MSDLARRRVGRVLLLEKAHLGAGASGKSGAIIRQHYSNALTATLAQRSLRIFEKFARLTDTTTAGGAGLGLAICREIMLNLGGDIAYVPGIWWLVMLVLRAIPERIFKRMNI